MSKVQAESISLRRLLLVIGGVALVLLFFGLAKSCADREQEAIFFSAVPDFQCPGLIVETSKQLKSWRGGVGYANAVLRMPDECRLRLAQLVRSGPFVEERCNTVERCWTRNMDRRRVMLTFYPAYVTLNVTDTGY